MQRYDKPYVINSDSFYNESHHHDKLTITYFSEDDTLVDENEDIIPDVESIIGEDALISFGDESDDPDIVYVRNERLAIDYEVVRCFKSYQQEVLGIDEPPQTKRRRRDYDD